MFNKEALEEIVRIHPGSFPAKKILENFDIYCGLHDAIGGKWIYGCGSYMIDGLTYDYNPRCLKKQEELYRYAMTAKNVLEVGVYVGHSLLIMLLANPNLNITAIDYDDTYTRPAIDYLNKIFNNRIKFIHSDAIEALNKLPDSYFDFIHIDADHNDEAVTKQFNACLALAKPNEIFIFDDYDAIRNTVDGLINKGLLKHIVTPDCLWRNCITQYTISDINKIVEISSKFSSCSKERLQCNVEAVNKVNSLGIPGSIVEIGVFRGGSMLAMMLANTNDMRNFYLYDTFEGMTVPCSYDIDLDNKKASELIEINDDVKCIATLDEVRQNITNNIHLKDDKVHYIVGDVTKTSVIPGSIAILRLDTDFYESTAFELSHFYDKVNSGGYVIIDDYGHWQGCRKAVDEFLLQHPEIKINLIDYTGIYFIKP